MKPVERDSPNDGEGLTWDDGKPLTKREGQAWWAGWEEGHSDGCAGMHEEMRFEIERLREVLRVIANNKNYTSDMLARAALGKGGK
jgi:hypothetical protein